MEAKDSFTQEEFEELQAMSREAIASIEPGYGARAFGGMVLKKMVVVPTLAFLFGLFGRLQSASSPLYIVAAVAAVVFGVFTLLSNFFEAGVYSAAVLLGWYSKRVRSNA